MDLLHSITMFAVVAAIMVYAKSYVNNHDRFRKSNRFWLFVLPFVYLFIALWIIGISKIKLNKWLYIIVYIPFLIGESIAVAETQYRFQHKLYFGHVEIKKKDKEEK